MPNKWVEHVKKYAEKNNISYAEALKCAMCKHEYRQMSGGALKDWVSPKAWKEYTTAIVKGRKDYPPKMRKIVEKYGNKKILKMYACRTPLSILTTTALNVASLGEFEKQFKETPYDDLFHLDLRVELEDGNTVLLEKNKVLNSIVNPKKAKNTECILILNVPKNLTINNLLEGGKKILGDRFLKYSAYDNNCQDYIMALLKGSNVGTQENYDFIKQNTKELFKNLPELRKIANTVIDIGSSLHTLIEGAGLFSQLTNIYKWIFPPESFEAWREREQRTRITQAELDFLKEIERIKQMEITAKEKKERAIKAALEYGVFEMVNKTPDLLEYGERERMKEEDKISKRDRINRKIEEEDEEFVGIGISKSNNYYVQSVVFNKPKYNKTKAEKWLKDNSFVNKGADITDTQIRFRQINPDYIKRKGFKRFITKKIGDGEISLIIAYN